MVGFVNDRTPAMIGWCCRNLENKITEFKGLASLISLHCTLHQEYCMGKV
jgi:hypothetical protein